MTDPDDLLFPPGAAGVLAVIFCVSIVLMSALVAAGCGGKDDVRSSLVDAAVVADVDAANVDTGDASVGPCAVDVPAVDAGSCATGELAVAPTSTIATPDPAPRNPILTASPSSDDFLAVWSDGTEESLGAIWASVLQPSAGGASATPVVQLSTMGTCPVATWTNAGFAVAWADSTGLELQQLEPHGALVGSSVRVLSGAGSMCAMSIASAGTGLALAWSSGASGSIESVALVDASGAAGASIVLGTVAPGAGADIALAELGDQTYAAYLEWPDTSSETAVARIDWSLASAVPVGTAPGFLQSFVAADNQLWLATESGGQYALYTAAPGAALQLAGQGCAAFDDLAVDGCGQLLGVGNSGFNPGGAAAFYAQAIGGAGSQVALGAASELAVAGAASTFGVLWFAGIGGGASQNGALSFTTLSWK